MLVEREDRGYYQKRDEAGLPQVTVFLSEQWVDDNADPVAINVSVTVPNEANEQ